MTIISMLAYQRTAKHWDSASLTATMIPVVKLPVLRLSRKITPNAHVRFSKIVNQSKRLSPFQQYFQEKCPLGCPCDDYECDLPEKKAILALYSGSYSKPSVLIQPNGQYSIYFMYSKITFKVVPLKTLSLKWMTIQKLTTLARQH